MFTITIHDHKHNCEIVFLFSFLRLRDECCTCSTESVSIHTMMKIVNTDQNRWETIPFSKPYERQLVFSVNRVTTREGKILLHASISMYDFSLVGSWRSSFHHLRLFRDFLSIFFSCFAFQTWIFLILTNFPHARMFFSLLHFVLIYEVDDACCFWSDTLSDEILRLWVNGLCVGSASFPAFQPNIVVSF